MKSRITIGLCLVLALAPVLQGCVTKAPTITTSTSITDQATGQTTTTTVTQTDTAALKAETDAMIAEAQAFLAGAQDVVQLALTVENSLQATAAQKEAAKTAAKVNDQNAILTIIAAITKTPSLAPAK